METLLQPGDEASRFVQLQRDMDDLRARSYFNARQARRCTLLEEELERIRAVMSSLQFRLANLENLSDYVPPWQGFVSQLLPGLNALGMKQARLKRDMSRIRQSELFDPIWYLMTYADIAAAKIDPVRHYIVAGADEGRSPGPKFNGPLYLKMYPDVAKSKLNPLLHYIQHGLKEGRLIFGNIIQSTEPV